MDKQYTAAGGWWHHKQQCVEKKFRQPGDIYHSPCRSLRCIVRQPGDIFYHSPPPLIYYSRWYNISLPAPYYKLIHHLLVANPSMGVEIDWRRPANGPTCWCILACGPTCWWIFVIEHLVMYFRPCLTSVVARLVPRGWSLPKLESSQQEIKSFLCLFWFWFFDVWMCVVGGMDLEWYINERVTPTVLGWESDTNTNRCGCVTVSRPILRS